jgi:hypothetical protein
VSAVRSRLSLPDMMFLYSETSSTMMHVGGLLPSPHQQTPPKTICVH